MSEVGRQRAIGLLEREWHELDTWLRSLSESDLDRPVFGEAPGWRVRDMIPHIAWWQGLAGRVAQVRLERVRQVRKELEVWKDTEEVKDLERQLETTSLRKEGH